MQCLYRSDYGPIDPHFDAQAGGGVLLKGFEGHESVLMAAQNFRQLAAMKRQLAHGGTVHWCDGGYAWTDAPAVTDFFYAVFVVLILPWLVLRVLPRLRRRRRAAALMEESSL